MRTFVRACVQASSVFLFVSLCLVCSQQPLAFSLMAFSTNPCLMLNLFLSVCVCLRVCARVFGVLVYRLPSNVGFGMKHSMSATSPLPQPFLPPAVSFLFPHNIFIPHRFPSHTVVRPSDTHPQGFHCTLFLSRFPFSPSRYYQ